MITLLVLPTRNLRWGSRREKGREWRVGGRGEGGEGKGGLGVGEEGERGKGAGWRGGGFSAELVLCE